MTVTFVRRRLGPGTPGQLVQPFSQFMPVSLASSTMLTILSVDFQKG